MNRINVTIECEGGFRATEIIADLREVAETLFNPLKLVGFWDSQADGMHICPQEQLGKYCPHLLPLNDPKHVSYTATADEYMRAILEVYFSHSDLTIYMK